MTNTNTEKTLVVKHNINAMRKAFLAAREGGNKSLISKKSCEELGISEGFFSLYTCIVDKLYNAACNYITIKHSVFATEQEKQVARELLYPLWKELLSEGEKNKTSKELRCSEYDIDSIVGYAEMFINDKNNVADIKDFVAMKEIAHKVKSRFRKDIETLMGIRIAGIEVMTDVQRDFLNAQKKIINKRKKAQVKLEATKQSLEAFKKFAKKGKETQKQIEEYEAIIKSCENNIKIANESLANLKPKTV